MIGKKAVSTLEGKKTCPCPKIVRESKGVANGVQVGYADWSKAVPRQMQMRPSLGKAYGED